MDMDKDGLVVVTGGGGFIGGHIVGQFLADGFTRVRSVDLKPVSDWYQAHDAADNRQLDCMDLGNCREALEGAQYVYNLAADMGGMGFIEKNKAACMLSVLINTHMLMAAKELGGVERFFFSSSACIYPAYRQGDTQVTALKEADAYPAEAEDGYGWEKLFSERMCRHFREDYGLETRIARYHNVYGPHGTWRGGREKAPAAVCRKVIEAKLSGNHEIEIWGDGEQTRSFMYIDDCVSGSYRIATSDILEPLNLGSDALVSINDLVGIVERIGGVSLKRRHKHDAPQGVRGRNSDNTMIQEQMGWAPGITLEDGLERTYRWIHDEIVRTGHMGAAVAR